MGGEGRVCLVTGAASGIGRALAGALAALGDRVVATDLDEPGLREAARREAWPASRVILRVQDVRDAGDWPRVIEIAFATWGRLDVLLNVAGCLRAGEAHVLDAGEVDLQLDVNAKGVIHGTRAAAERFLAQGHGHVVNIASLAALCPLPGLSVYAASKAAVRAFSLSAAYELVPRGVHVSVVCPDAVATPLLEGAASHPEAAIAFSAPPLEVRDVVRRVVDDVLRRRPVEVAFPRGRALLARASALVPGLARSMAPFFIRRGERRRKALRHESS